MPNEYVARNDYIGLSSESKPSPVVDGTTFFEVDTEKFYIYYKGEWYEMGAEQETEPTEPTENNNR